MAALVHNKGFSHGVRMHVHFPPASSPQPVIEFSKFLEVDIRIGEIVEVLEFPEARNASYKLKIQLGKGIGIKKSSAQLTHHYTKKDLIGKKVLAVVNFTPKQVANTISEVLILGLSDENKKIVLFELDHPVENGSRLL